MIHVKQDKKGDISFKRSLDIVRLVNHRCLLCQATVETKSEDFVVCWGEVISTAEPTEKSVASVLYLCPERLRMGIEGNLRVWCWPIRVVVAHTK
jgi:hypothetical protein